MHMYFKKHTLHILVVLLFAIGTGVSFYFDWQTGILLVRDTFWVFLKEMILFLPLMFILIGLADVWIDKEKVKAHIGETSGIKGMAIVVLLSMTQAGPLYGAFPVAYLLWKKGASVRNIFIYLGAFSTLKIPMLTFEIGFLGWKFSLLRTLLTLPLILVIGIIFENYYKNKKFMMNEPK